MANYRRGKDKLLFGAMCYRWEWMKHFFKSNSRHGTHSPFVYALAEQVLYKNRQDETSSVILPAGFYPHYGRLLQEILSFWGIKELQRLPLSGVVKAVWVDLRKDPIKQVLESIEGGALVVVHEPYRRKGLWKQAKRDQRVTVSIDLFYFGLLLRRDEQRREEFKLRYPFRWFRSPFRTMHELLHWSNPSARAKKPR